MNSKKKIREFVLLEKSTPRKCVLCNEKEPIHNYIFECQKYSTQREILERGVEDILARNDIKLSVINLRTLTGNLEDVNSIINCELRTAFGKFIRSTGRLVHKH